MPVRVRPRVPKAFRAAERRSSPVSAGSAEPTCREPLDSFLISRQSASQTPPMGRPDRPARGRACSACSSSAVWLGASKAFRAAKRRSSPDSAGGAGSAEPTCREPLDSFLISRQSAPQTPPMGRPDRPARGRACSAQEFERCLAGRIKGFSRSETPKLFRQRRRRRFGGADMSRALGFLLISRRSDPQTPPMGRPDRPARGRACSALEFELSLFRRAPRVSACSG